MNDWKKNFALILLAETVSIVAFSFICPFLPYYIQHLGVSDPKQVILWSGLIVTAPAFFLALSAPVWGVLGDRFGRKFMLVRAICSGAIILFLMGIAQTVVHLFIFRLFQGIFTGTIAAAFALTASIVPREKSVQVQGLMQTMVFFGSAVGPWLGGMAADAWGYQNSFFISAAALFIAGLVTAVGVRERFIPPEPVEQPRFVRRLMPARAFLPFFLVLFLVQAAASLPTPIFPLFVQRLLPPGTTNLAGTAGSIFAVSGFAAMAAALIVGRLGTKVRLVPLLITCLFCCGILSFLQCFSQTTLRVLLVQGGFGFFAGVIIPVVNAMLHQRSSTDEMGRTFGTAAGVTALGGGVGPFIGGGVASLFSLRAAFVASGMLMIGSVIAARMAFNRSRS